MNGVGTEYIGVHGWWHGGELVGGFGHVCIRVAVLGLGGRPGTSCSHPLLGWLAGAVVSSGAQGDQPSTLDMSPIIPS